ncbi:MAG: DUF4194 domain-containing protein [Clostridia bacterium]|nr:DUF4194 domain-containing protein [Clostridia bacterium]
MIFEEMWEELTERERGQFQRTSRMLLKHTFLVRDKEKTKPFYQFILRYQELLENYFGYMGFEVLVDKENGVAMLRNDASAASEGELVVNRHRFRKVESIVLCSLWTMYADRMRSGTLQRIVTVSVPELQFQLEKFGARDFVDKTALSNTLTLLSQYNLLSVEGKVGQEDCLIHMFPSMQFAMDSASFQRFVDEAAARMKGTKREELQETWNGEEEEDAE